MKNLKELVFKTSFSVFMSLLFLSVASGQKSINGYSGMNYDRRMLFVKSASDGESFYVSAAPVTNREYILYLVWTQTVYGNDYPEVLFSALPGYGSSSKKAVGFLPFADSASFRLFLRQSEPWVAEYMFNPLYLNSAVIGISWEQANRYAHWLSDRYNEYSLIRLRYLNFDPNQLNGSTFTTESFIFRQYEGVINKLDVLPSVDPFAVSFRELKFQLRPSFHIATKSELIAIPSSLKLVDCLCSDPYTPDFLKPFYSYYLNERKGMIHFNPEPFAKDKAFSLVSGYRNIKAGLPSKIREWCLDSYTSSGERSISAIYRIYGYDSIGTDLKSTANFKLLAAQKDSLGQMPFQLIGEKGNGKFEIIGAPVGIKRRNESLTSYIYDHNTGTVFSGTGDIYTCFRVAVKAINKQ